VPPARTATTTTSTSSTAPAAISLVLHGGGNATVSACGASHHYRTYSAGTSIRLTGIVRPIPAGRWKVKLKVKVCRAGSFSDVAKVVATRDKHHGTFKASFTAQPAGLYAVRAGLYVNGSLTARSNKRHFQTR
jgi:hypothetical protein